MLLHTSDGNYIIILLYLAIYSILHITSSLDDSMIRSNPHAALLYYSASYSAVRYSVLLSVGATTPTSNKKRHAPSFRHYHACWYITCTSAIHRADHVLYARQCNCGAVIRWPTFSSNERDVRIVTSRNRISDEVDRKIRQKRGGGQHGCISVYMCVRVQIYTYIYIRNSAKRHPHYIQYSI